jgi:hypothetical protein
MVVCGYLPTDIWHRLPTNQYLNRQSFAPVLLTNSDKPVSTLMV